jgi:hypothetical protein
MATNNKPVNTLRCGNIKATIWQNSRETGSLYLPTFLLSHMLKGIDRQLYLQALRWYAGEASRPSGAFPSNKLFALIAYEV